MNFVYQADLAMGAPEAFERMRAFARVYPQLHPAHDPHAPEAEPALLHSGYQFVLGERFGIEQRRYRFVVEAYEPGEGYMRLKAATRTRWGPVGLGSTLTLEFRVAATATGARLTVSQRVSLGPAWLDRLLDRPWLWRGVAAHADAECAAAVALLTREGYAA